MFGRFRRAVGSGWVLAGPEVARWWWLPPSVFCVVFDANRLWGWKGIVSGLNDSVRSTGDNDSSSSWWDKGPGLKIVIWLEIEPEYIGIKARRCEGAVRGEIELETHESVLIHIDFDPGMS